MMNHYRVVFSHGPSLGRLLMCIDVLSRPPLGDDKLQAMLVCARNMLAAELDNERYSEQHIDYEFVGFSRLERCGPCGRMYESARPHRCDSN